MLNSSTILFSELRQFRIELRKMDAKHRMTAFRRLIPPTQSDNLAMKYVKIGHSLASLGELLALMLMSREKFS